MKLGLQNYTVIISNENSCIKCNKSNTHNLQIYDNAHNYTILHKVVQRLSQHNLNSNHRHIQTLRQRK
jgi:hypothetical protein